MMTVFDSFPAPLRWLLRGAGVVIASFVVVGGAFGCVLGLSYAIICAPLIAAPIFFVLVCLFIGWLTEELK